MVERSDLQKAVESSSGEKHLSDSVDPKSFPHVHSDQSLELALERMGVSGLDVLPVVGRADIRELEGIVALSDVLQAYGVGPSGGS